MPTKMVWVRLVLIGLVIGIVSLTFGGCPLAEDMGWVKKDKDTFTGSSATLPDQVVSSNPTNGATNFPITKKLSWVSAPEATSYDVYFGTTNPPPYCTNTTGTTYNPGTLNYLTTYYWRVDSKNSGGITEGNVWIFQTIADVPAAQVSLPNPATGLIDIPIATSPSWASAARATSYDVYLGTTNPPPYCTNTTGTTYNPGPLNYLTTYYWRVDSKNSGGITEGNVWNFQTETEPAPAQVGSPNPGNGLIDIPIATSLSWTSAAGATSYDVYFGTTNPPPYYTNTTGTTYNPGTLNYLTTYYWRVDSKNSGGITEGNVWIFQTIADVPAAQVSLPNPATGLIDIPIATSPSWASAARATSYDVYLGTTNPPPYCTNTTGTTYNPGPLNYLTTYYWRVDSKNSGGITEGNVWNFQTETEPAPAQVGSPNPGNGVTGVPITTSPSWASAAGATSYDIYFGTTNPPPYCTNTTGTTYNPGPLNYLTTYYWRVDSKNSVGTTTGNVWVFQIEAAPITPPAQVTDPNPPIGATKILLNQELGWVAAAGATSYNVYLDTSYPPTTFKANTSSTSYALPYGTLKYDTTYYWRIDSKNSVYTTPGIIWYFQTHNPPAQVTLPNPPNEMTGVLPGTWLNWASAAGATSYDIYFGTTNPPPYCTNTTGTTYNPGTLNYFTTYYWRIDSKNTAGTTTGVLWSFATSAWVYSTLDSVGDVGRYTSIAVDKNNKVHISYYDYTSKDLKYATDASGSWLCFTLEATGDVGSYTSIAVDSHNKVHISYCNATNGALKYATDASGSWVYSTLDSAGPISDTSIALDSNNYVHISYYHATSKDLKYATNKSGGWVYSTLDSAGDVGSYPSIAVSGTATTQVHISYYDVTNGDLKYATNVTGVWVYATIPDTGDIGRHTSIAVDKNNKVHISYYDVTNQDLKYATNKLGAWASTILDTSGDMGWYTSIALDSNNKVLISYYDATNQDLKYAINASGNWVCLTLISTGDVGRDSRITLDSNNRVHISYYDATNGDLKYATNK